MPQISNIPVLYLENLSWITNQNYIVPRNSAGRIDINTNESTVMVIEPVQFQIQNKKFLNKVDTQFTYFEFPTDVKIPDNIIELPDTEILVPDKTSILYDLQGQDQNFKTEYFFKSAYNNIVAGATTNTPWTELPFRVSIKGGLQLYEDRFTITEDILNRGKNLKLSVKLLFADRLSPAGVNNFYNVRFRAASKEFRSEIADVINITTGQKFPMNEFEEVRLEYIIDISTAQEFDEYYVEAYTGNEAVIGIRQSYFRIEEIE
jgi:hypothetical protein